MRGKGEGGKRRRSGKGKIWEKEEMEKWEDGTIEGGEKKEK